MFNSPTPLDLLLLVSATGVLLLLISKHIRAPRSSSPLPPGPGGYPLIGNIFGMPSSREWETFTEWGRKYGGFLFFFSVDRHHEYRRCTGPITYFHLAGEHYVVLNSLEKTLEMLEAKSAIYSDRPIFPMLGKTMGWDRGLVLAPYGERFRAFRRLLHRFMGTHAIISNHHDAITRHTNRFLRRLLDTPEQFMEHLRGYASMICSSLHRAAL